MKTKILEALCVVLTVLGGVLPCDVIFADDLNPPPYRGDPLSVFAEWQFVPGSTILNLTQSNWVDDNDPTTVLHPLPFSSPVAPNNPGHYQFQLPNWLDNMPIKYLRAQLTWMVNLSAPISIASQGLDGTNTVWGQIVYASPVFVDTSQTYAYQYYDLIYLPNPDFERLDIVLQPDSVLTQLVVDTVSTVPEPSSLAMLAIGALSLIRRKKD